MKNLIVRLYRWDLFRFGLVGCCDVVLDAATYYFLLSILIPMPLCKLSAYIIGTISGFLLNKFFTFKAHGFSLLEIVKYILVYIATAFVNVALNQFVYWLSENKLIAFAIATVVSGLLHFICDKFIVFVKGSKNEKDVSGGSML